MIISLIAIGATLLFLSLFNKVESFSMVTREITGKNTETEPEPLDESAEVGIKRDLVEWVDGGRIGLYCPDAMMKKSMTVVISSHKNDGHQSYAQISEPGKRFRCRKGGPHSIYGVYPASAMLATKDTVKVTGHISEEQILSRDPENPRLYKSEGSYMYAVSSLEAGSGMRLAFRPLMTTVSFRIHSPAENYLDKRLLGLTLRTTREGGSLAGSFTTALNAETGVHEPLNPSDITDGTDAINVSFAHGILLGDSKEDDVTIQIQTIPMDHSGLRLTLHFEGNVRRSLNLMKNDAWIDVPACTRTDFNNLGIPGVITPGNEQPLDYALCVQGLA